MEPDRNFPRLSPTNHRLTSPASVEYNCIAWAAGDFEHWWQPGVYWPEEISTEDFGLGALEAAFRMLGYEPCDDASLEPGFEKVALYGDTFAYTHMARQLPDGNWTSKLGKAEDVEHDAPDVVAGGVHGEVMEIMKRPSGA